MATKHRRRQVGAAAVTLGVALPLISGDLLVIVRVVATLGHVLVALP